MIYIDASVALAHLLLEERRPPAYLWDRTLTASRLLQYEVWTVLHAGSLVESHGEAGEALLSRIALLELSPPVLTRALQAFPVPVRTLDALHLATVAYLHKQGQTIELATYDRRMSEAARVMGVPLSDLTA